MNKKILMLAIGLVAVAMLTTPMVGTAQACRWRRSEPFKATFVLRDTDSVPYPGGFTRFGFKLGSEKYDFMKKTLNTKYCPKLDTTEVPKGSNVAYQIILAALDVTALFEMLKIGIEGIENYKGITKITSSSFESKLGTETFDLKMLL